MFQAGAVTAPRPGAAGTPKAMVATSVRKCSGIRVKVRFRQNDDGIQTTVVDQRQETFDTAQVKIPVQAANDEHGIEVCRNDLLFRGLSILLATRAGGPPGKLIFPL